MEISSLKINEEIIQSYPIGSIEWQRQVIREEYVKPEMEKRKDERNERNIFKSRAKRTTRATNI